VGNQDGSPRLLTGGAAMMEDPIFIQRNISNFGAMLNLHMGDECRANLERLLAEAKKKLLVATILEVQQR
jgi:hypothetical protein